MAVTGLEHRVQRIEDIEAIRRLKASYAERCDDGFDPGGLVELFTDDGVWDCGEYGILRGREAMAAYWRETGRITQFSQHFMTNHVVDVDPGGEEASGRCYMFGTVTREGIAQWMAVRYTERYRKVEGRWLFSLMKLHPGFMTPFEHSWAGSLAAEDG